MFPRNSLTSEPFYVAKVKFSLQVVARICKQSTMHEYLSECLHYQQISKYSKKHQGCSTSLLDKAIRDSRKGAVLSAEKYACDSEVHTS